MKRTLMFLCAAAFLAAAGVAWAGDCGSSCGGGCCGTKEEFSCKNACPLAQEANKHRSYGTECSVAKAALASQVEKNLAKI